MKQIRPEETYIKKMFNRLDLQQIRAFLLYGTEEGRTETKTYNERLREGSDPIFSRIDLQYADDEKERDSAASDISHALSTHEDVYMEIGMKVGARLMYQLLLDDVPHPETEKETH